MKEIWRDVAEYEGYYQVSNLGNVRSVERTVARSNYFVVLKSQVLKPAIRTAGYLFVNLSKDSKVKTKNIHRLVADAFLPNPQCKQEVNHKNGNKTDNNINNLEWCSRSENMIHSYDVLGNRRFGKDNPRAKVILQIKNGKVIGRFYGCYEAERMTGVKYGNINQCCNHRRKTANKYEWRYENENI